MAGARMISQLHRNTAVLAGAVQRFAQPVSAHTNPRRGLTRYSRAVVCTDRGGGGGEGDSEKLNVCGRSIAGSPWTAQKLLTRASCRQLSHQAQNGQVAGVEPADGQAKELEDKANSSEATTVSNFELNQRWGWTTSDPLYWPYKILGVFSTKNTNALSSVRMLQTCLNNAECPQWYSHGKISNEFLPKLLWLGTNVWLISRRLLREGERGKKVQELLFDELWRETKRQMRSIEVSEMMLKKYLGEAQQHTFMTLVQYDHAYTLESREERMHVLTSALWRGVFMGDESMKESHVRVLAEYIDSELADIYSIDALDFFSVCFELAPPPVEELEAAAGRKKLPQDGEEGLLPKERALAGTGQSGLGERVHHGDNGGDAKEGRWRACLAESGKVYYWHTVTREVTWSRPADSEAYVPSTMPKTDQTPATTAA